MINGKPNLGGFFEHNNEFRYIPEVTALILTFGEEKADRYMWGLWMVYHPDSALFDMPMKDKCDTVATSYLKEADFDWILLDEVLSVWPKLAMTHEERMYYDAVRLYEDSLKDAKSLMPDKKAMFIKSINAAADMIEKMRGKYLRSKQNSVRAAGEIQSGWASGKKGAKFNEYENL
jgi:hypothetical protein